uniref:Major sperm protein n=1 Tax=Meloidogyne hapla TaxID=6305 RepID=A0A1I8B575_MELHA
MAFIAINEGMNTGSRSASTSDSLQLQKDCKVVYGEFVPVGGSKMHGEAKDKVIVNNPNLPNELIVSGGDKSYKVTLQVENQNNNCTAKNDKKPVKCTIKGDKLTGKIIFDIADGPSVHVPFKNTPIFVGNKCEIVYENYNNKDHKMTLYMNKVKLMIAPSDKQIVKTCGAGN